MRRATFVLLVTFAVLSTWHSRAQTNAALFNTGEDAEELESDLINGHSLRVVNGQLYADISILWTTLQGECLSLLTNGLVISTFTMEPIYQVATTTEYVPTGLLSPDKPVLVAKKVQVGENKVQGIKIILRNYPTDQNLAVGETISFRAMRVGTSNCNGEAFELWDYGAEPTQDELSKLKDEAGQQQKAEEKEMYEQNRAAAESAAAAKKAMQDKVLKWNQEQADKGNAYGLLRMGERYLNGEDVPKDLNKAKEYLTKAAAAGDTTAESELAQIQTNVANQGDIEASNVVIKSAKP